MKRPGAVWGASLGALLGYTLASFLPFLPRLFYYPRPGTWSFARIPDEPAIGWFGWLLTGAIGAGVGAAACARLARAPSSRWLVGTAFACLLVLAWHGREWFAR